MTRPDVADRPQETEEADTGAPAGSERSLVEINTALADLKVAGGSVGNREWLSGDLMGEPAVSLGMLGSTASPLSALASAGCDFLIPMISFLEEPLNQLRGEPDSVSGPSGEHDRAAQGANAVAEDYGSTSEQETSEWSGGAKGNYSETVTKLTDGIKTIAEAAATNSKAMIAAGEVVAQVVDIVTRLITEAVGKIVPIITEAIAAAAATFGASIAQAIPQCVAIAVDYGGQIAAKLAALLASGENLMKLVDGALAALDVAKEGLTVIGDLAGGESSGAAGESAGASGDSGSSESDSATSGSRGSDSSGSGSSPASATGETDYDTGRSTGEETEPGSGRTSDEGTATGNPLDGEWRPVQQDQPSTTTA